MEKIWSEQPEYRHNLLDLSSKQNNFQMPEVLTKALHGYYNYTPPETFSGQRKPHHTDAINPIKRNPYWKGQEYAPDDNYYDIPSHYGMPRNKKQQWADRLLRNENVPEDINQYYINKSAGATPEPEPESTALPTTSLGDAPEPPAESTSSAKSNDDGGFNQMDYMSQSAGGGSITPKATVINPMAYMYPSMPPGVGAGTPASPAVGSDEWISAQAAKHGMPLP